MIVCAAVPLVVDVAAGRSLLDRLLWPLGPQPAALAPHRHALAEQVLVVVVLGGGGGGEEVRRLSHRLVDVGGLASLQGSGHEVWSCGCGSGEAAELPLRHGGGLVGDPEGVAGQAEDHGELVVFPEVGRAGEEEQLAGLGRRRGGGHGVAGRGPGGELSPPFGPPGVVVRHDAAVGAAVVCEEGAVGRAVGRGLFSGDDRSKSEKSMREKSIAKGVN